MRSSPRFQLLAAALGVSTTAGVARADQATADKLFKEGSAFLESGKVAEACAKFDASKKENDALATLEALADCEERWGHYQRAYQLFGDVAARSSAAFDDATAERANARRKALAPKVGAAETAPPPTVVVVQEPPAAPPAPPVDDSPAAGWIVLGSVGIAGGLLMTGVAIGLFVDAADKTGAEKTEATAGGVALIILGPLAIAGGIGFVYWGAHPSKTPPVNMNPFASVPDLVVGPRYAGVRWHF